MTILNDKTIEKYIEEGALLTSAETKFITPNGYDLRVDKIRVNGVETEESAEIPAKTHFYVSTMESAALPDNISGQLWIRTSYARKGVIGSFGFIDAGYRGQLTLCFYNASTESIHLAREDRIAQIVFNTMSDYATKNYEKRSGNYQNSKGIRLQ